MGIWNWNYWRNLAVSVKDKDSPLYWGGEEWAGETVTRETANNISAWWRARRLYADVAGTCALKVYERTNDDQRVRNKDHEVARIIASEPNFDNTAKEFWSAQAMALITDGNAYAEKMQGAGGRLISLELLPHDTIPFRKPDGTLRYKFYERGKEHELPPEKVFHTRSFYEGGDLGKAPRYAAGRSLALSLATDRAAASTFSKDMRSKGFFTVPQLLSPEQRAQAKKVLIDPFTGPNAAQWGILEAGFDFKSVNINPRDAEMLLNRRHNVEDVCRWLGVPPILVGHAAEGQTMWGSGVENIILSWRTLGLDSFLGDIETSINKRLFSAPDRRKYYAEYDRDSLMQADSVARSAILNSSIQNAQLTPNEGRKMQNRPPQLGGDQLLINSTLIPLTMAGKQNEKPAAPEQPAPETVEEPA